MPFANVVRGFPLVGSGTVGGSWPTCLTSCPQGKGPRTNIPWCPCIPRQRGASVLAHVPTSICPGPILPSVNHALGGTFADGQMPGWRFPQLCGVPARGAAGEPGACREGARPQRHLRGAARVFPQRWGKPAAGPVIPASWPSSGASGRQAPPLPRRERPSWPWGPWAPAWTRASRPWPSGG